MRKFFILTLMVASLMMVSCVERRNRVIIDKFIPIDQQSNCEIKAGGDIYHTEGLIDLAFTFDYFLAFEVTNHLPSSDGGDSSLTTAEANYFYLNKVEIEYEWDPRPQADGRKLSLDQKLWNKKIRKPEHAKVIPPNESGAAGGVHIFEEAQAKNLLEHVNDIDWIASPLIIKIRGIGELADGTEVKTNQMNFNIIPTFGTTIQMFSTYYQPAEGFGEENSDDEQKAYEAKKARYDAIVSQCAFNDKVLADGCLLGQDASMHNCYAGDTDWERYIVETYSDNPYIPGLAAAGVVEMYYNKYKKSADDGGYYLCCPGEEPEEPEEPEKEENNNAASGSGE